ncbi:MAG: hypothetical protein PHQ75_13995, partial [Thermoguttaceae bacterium]|nr:hypothetical protein [Thermoguttaceae bacterium]
MNGAWTVKIHRLRSLNSQRCINTGKKIFPGRLTFECQEKSLTQWDCVFARAHDEIGKYADQELIGLAYQYHLNHGALLRS